MDLRSLATILSSGLDAEEAPLQAALPKYREPPSLTPGGIGAHLTSSSTSAPQSSAALLKSQLRAKAAASASLPTRAPPPTAVSSRPDIWDADEAMTSSSGFSTEDDGRRRPEHEVRYRQNVSSEDIYLGMGEKKPSASHADEVVVTVKLPGVRFGDIVIDCTADVLDVRCPQFKLVMPFPKPVDDANGTAKWNPEKQELVVVAPIRKDIF
ncbi:Protein pih1d3 [Irineochytrium annulatum]|nr:Protein pih1d3 [Irineochytrium annulatum]